MMTGTPSSADLQSVRQQLGHQKPPQRLHQSRHLLVGHSAGVGGHQLLRALMRHVFKSRFWTRLLKPLLKAHQSSQPPSGHRAGVGGHQLQESVGSDVLDNHIWVSH